MTPKIESRCFICDNEKENTFLYVLEMMLQSNEKFSYLECANCGCLSLTTIPENMGQYYPSTYYSFKKEPTKNIHKNTESIKKYLRVSSMKEHIGIGTTIDKFINRVRPISYQWLKKYLVTFESKILDVGCGNGFLIEEMSRYGFTNLYGIDLFTPKKIQDENFKIYQTDIYGLKEEEFDLIMYHHSFEHIANPHKELQVIYSKLSDTGTLILRVPLCDSFAFRHYKENWVQLDAPRHYFLYTRKSMEILANMHGFEVYDYMYDSNAFQFVGSECYVHNKSVSEAQKLFTENQLTIWADEAKKLNELEDGDSICFYLKKTV